MGQGAPDGRAKGDFGGIKSRQKLDGVWGVRVVGVADAGEEAKESGVEVSAQDGEFPQHSLQTRHSVRLQRETRHVCVRTEEPLHWSGSSMDN